MHTYINVSLSQNSSYANFISSRWKQVYLEVSNSHRNHIADHVSHQQNQMWCMSFMHVINYVLRIIFGSHLFMYLDAHIEANKEWFLDKVNVIICLLAHGFTFHHIETVVNNHFGGYTINLDHIYPQCYFLLMKILTNTIKKTSITDKFYG